MNSSHSKTYLISLVVLVFVCGLASGSLFFSNQKSDTGEAIATEGSSLSPAERQADVGSDQLDAATCFRMIAEAHETRDIFKSHYYTIALIERLAPNQFELLLNQMLESQGGQWNILKLIVLIKWITIEPNQVFAFFKTRSEDRRVLSLVPLAFRYWAQADYKAAYSFANRLPNRAKRSAFGAFRGLNDPRLNALMGGGNGSLAVTAIEEAFQVKLWEKDQNQFNQLLTTQFRNDPQAALGWLSQIPNENARSQALMRLSYMSWPNTVEALSSFSELFTTGTIAKRDMQQVLRNVTSRTSGEDTLKTYHWLKGNLSQNDFLNIIRNVSFHRAGADQLKELISEFQQLPSSRMKQQQISNHINQLANVDWEVAFDWISNALPPSQAETYIPNMMDSAYRHKGGEGVNELWSKIQSKEQRKNAMQHLANSWGNTNLMEFVDWTLSIDDTDVMESGLQAVSHQWAANDPEGARLFSDALPEGNLKRSFQYAIGNGLSNLDPIKAIEYAIQVEDKNTSTNIARNAFSQWAQTDPLGAFNSALEIFQDDERASNIISNIAAQWSSSDLDGAIDHIREIENEKIRQAGLDSVAQRMASQNPEALVTRLDDLPKGSDRDTVLRSLATNRRFALRDLDAAEALMNQISDPATRETVAKVIEGYRKQRSTYGRAVTR